MNILGKEWGKYWLVGRHSYGDFQILPGWLPAAVLLFQFGELFILLPTGNEKRAACNILIPFLLLASLTSNYPA